MLALRLWSLRQGPCQVTGAEPGDSRDFHDLLREAQTEGKQVSSRMCVILEVGSCRFLGGAALTFGAGDSSFLMAECCLPEQRPRP